MGWSTYALFGLLGVRARGTSPLRSSSSSAGHRCKDCADSPSARAQQEGFGEGGVGCGEACVLDVPFTYHPTTPSPCIREAGLERKPW